jgi:acetylornithine deacetylase/succinyl-diaminopimelate desuccinylase-like protein
MRIVADQTPEEVTAKLRAAIAKACPLGVTAEYSVIHSAPPSLVDPKTPFIQSAAAALTEVFGVETVYMRSGGSIPIVGLFQQHLGIASVMIGFGLPDDNLHAPNEKFHLPNFYSGIKAVARYLEVLGR